MQKKVSIIIPACNEEGYLRETINSLRNQDCQNLEIIVVVNGSKDKTFEIAKQYADRTLSFSESLGPSGARMEGAKIAKGDLLLFLDADTQLSKNVVSSVAEALESNIIGTCLARPGNKNLKGQLFFGSKNLVHRLKIVKSVIDGVIFCQKELFFEIGGFDKKILVAEFHDLIKRARKVGVKYKCLTNCYAVVSTRRYEKEGYFKIIFYWIKWIFSHLFKKDKKISTDYWEKNKK